MNIPPPLIGTDELSRRLNEVVVCDIRWSLSDPSHGVTAYESGHIPGAVFVDLDHDLAGEPGPGRHPLPEPGAFLDTLGRLGIDPQSEVVVYDDAEGMIAARMWWMLRSIGHHRSRLLDGGYNVWVGEGREIETGHNQPTPVSYRGPAYFSGVAQREDLEGRTLIDLRSAARYAGLEEPVDPKAGHIPGAVNRPAEGNLAPDGRFQTPDTLARLYREIGSNAVVYCGSGVTACHGAVAMVLAGRDLPDVYVGSFSEWSRLDLPVATGDS
ncbi:MAG: sulfurtransferase [Acidimicrobiia bacterium]